MKRGFRLAALALMVAATTTPAIAGWKLVPAQTATAVAKGKLTVTPDSAWNRWTVRPIKKGEIWTLDGVQLNEVYFVTGLSWIKASCSPRPSSTCRSRQL